jgi:hypothetical protein
MATAEGCLYNTERHGTRKSAVGLSIGGIDATKLPPWVKSFSVVRTPAAGRVVCQGIAMYALTPQSPGSSPSLVKAKDKVWFYSPETDPNIGDKISIFDDIKANPSNYQIQLVSPVGFFTDVYSAYQGDAGAAGYTVKIDMISHAIMGGNNVDSMEPIGFDASNEIGVGEGRVTFGRFRNEYSWPYVGGQGSGLVSSNLTFNIAGASEVALNGYGDISNRSRTPYLELSLSTELYYYTDVDSESGDTNTSRNFHEPWYVVNIIKEGEEIANNNVNSYNDIGHFIKLESLIGLGNGESDQVFELINERIEDVYTLGETTNQYRYIWVDGQPWLGVDNVATGSINTYRAALFSAGLFTPTGGLTCYGIYKAAYVLKTTGDYYYISFPYSNTGGVPICPIAGAEVKIKYNNNSPIELFLGDTYVHDAIFAPIDCNLENQRNLSTASGVLLNAPMPYFNFIMAATGYYQPRNPEGGGGVITNVFEQGGGGNPHQMEFIRQWLVSFGCESSVNLPFIYKNYFPNRNYVMRPAIYNAKLDSETVAEYLDDVGIYSYYNTDYPDECLNWGYGGFHLPSGANWDYEKNFMIKYLQNRLQELMSCCL